jgi:hypothetical protein
MPEQMEPNRMSAEGVMSGSEIYISQQRDNPMIKNPVREKEENGTANKEKNLLPSINAKSTTADGADKENVTDGFNADDQKKQHPRLIHNTIHFPKAAAMDMASCASSVTQPEVVVGIAPALIACAMIARSTPMPAYVLPG